VLELTVELIMPMSVIRAMNYIRMHSKKFSQKACIRMYLSFHQCEMWVS